MYNTTIYAGLPIWKKCIIRALENAKVSEKMSLIGYETEKCITIKIKFVILYYIVKSFFVMELLMLITDLHKCFKLDISLSSFFSDES